MKAREIQLGDGYRAWSTLSLRLSPTIMEGPRDERHKVRALQQDMPTTWRSIGEGFPGGCGWGLWDC